MTAAVASDIMERGGDGSNNGTDYDIYNNNSSAEEDEYVVYDDPDDNKHLHKSKRKKKKSHRKQRSGNQSGFLYYFFPSKIVCTATTSGGTMKKKSSNNNETTVVEWGLILSTLTFILYFIGFCATVISLPPDNNGQQLWQDMSYLRHLGENFNLANTESDWRKKATTTTDDDHHQEEDPADADNADAAGLDGKTSSEQRIMQQQQQQQQPQRLPPLGEVVIPPSKWPVTLRDEDEAGYDKIVHPGDQETVMKVPKFWSYPIHQNGLMSRETALQVGSCIQSDDPNNFSRGEASCPLNQRTIYVGIASYRDFQCRFTVESIFLRAKYPERIRVGVVDQIVHGEDDICNAPIKDCKSYPDQALCKYQNQVDVYEMEAELSIGPVFARHIGYRMYRGEYYATQSDAHVTYTQNWDVDIISQHEETHDEMAVLSTYLTDVQGSISPDGHSLRNTRPIMCNTMYEGGVQGAHLRHGSQPERLPGIHGSPQLQPWWAAGYSFSRGHFIVNVPYDWNSAMIFQGEEMSIGIRGFTIGYDYYAPERSVCFHHYAVGKNAQVRNKVHHFWENGRNYEGTGKRAMKRLLGLVHMNPEVPPESWDHTDEDIYGCGGVRTTEKFYETFGIDVVGKTVQNHLCSFVDTNGQMHKTFTPLLRPDGMGIDYGKISYRFKDPAPDKDP